MIEFSVVNWAAWAPGLQTRAAWQDWAKAPTRPMGDDMPALPEVPALQRRRIDRLGRMAMQAALWCDDAGPDEVPLVFASRHGDVQRSCELLQQLVSGEPMSPAQFGLSVHNAVAALHSIVQGKRGNYLALAAGKATAESALLEAAGLLADGAPGVQVVVYEAALPQMHVQFADEPDACYAWSWGLRRAGADGRRLSLAWCRSSRAAEEQVAEDALPAGLDAMRFLLSDAVAREHHVDGTCWQWRCQRC